MSTYYMIYLKLKKEIEEKKYLPNTAIPSERVLMEIFGASRTTIRYALFLLEKEKLIYKIQGKGNFVSSKAIIQNLNTFYSFHDKIESLGEKPKSKILKYKKLKANEFFSELFGIGLENEIYEIKRLRLIENKPIMLETTYLPVNRFKNLNVELLNEVAMYKLFKNEYNVVFEKAEETFKAIQIYDKKEAEKLEIKKNSIAMEIIRKTYEFGKIIEYTISHTPAEYFEYTVQLKL